MSEMSSNDIRTFHLRLTREEYEELERIQTVVNETTGKQRNKSEIIKMALSNLIFDLSNLMNYSSMNGSDE